MNTQNDIVTVIIYLIHSADDRIDGIIIRITNG